MAENHLTTEQAEKRVKAIKDHLEDLQRTSNFIYSLANYRTECEHEAVELSIDTLFFFGAVMGMAADTISAELGLLEYAGRPEAKAYTRNPQAAAQGGEA